MGKYLNCHKSEQVLCMFTHALVLLLYPWEVLLLSKPDSHSRGTHKFWQVPRWIYSLSTLRTTAVRSSHFQHKYCSSIFLINQFCFIVHSINYLQFKLVIKSIQAFPVFIIQLSKVFPYLSFFLFSLGILSTLDMHPKGSCI